MTPGGGGWGDPLERPTDLVAADVREGFVTREPAAEAYGVVIGADGAVDEPATTEARRRIRDAR